MNNATLPESVGQLFEQQLAAWPLARANYAALADVVTRRFEFDDFAVMAQFNPRRIASTAAAVDSRSVAERPCFLCPKNRPPEQAGIDVADYSLLVNPFPIFPRHLTIAHHAHRPQRIASEIGHMLSFARQLPEFVVFYNGPHCGASAPDHLHFQAGNADFLPLIGDYFRLKATHAAPLYDTDSYRVERLDAYLRTLVCVSAETAEAAADGFVWLYRRLEEGSEEPMLNLLAYVVGERYYLFVFPRLAFRPWQYSADEPQRLLISPATVEMSGVIILPVERHFERLTKEDIIAIYNEVSTPSYSI